MMDEKSHWEDVYRTKPATEVSWYAAHLADSLELIRKIARPEARLIDVGGGASTLVDDLLSSGYRHLTVLDLSSAALEVAKRRLGSRASEVTWLEADITKTSLDPGSFDLWHDRAVFHFLTAEPARKAYAAALRRALAPGGHVVISTFSLTGPPQCSGLDVVRYDAAGLLRELGDGFVLLEARERGHVTPAGREQRFVTCCFRFIP